MEQILHKSDNPDIVNLENVKYELGDTNSLRHLEDDDSRDVSMELEEELFKDDPLESNDMHFPNYGTELKQETKLDLETDIIFPQASHSYSISTPKAKKEVKSKRELEEEEREKMQ